MLAWTKSSAAEPDAPMHKIAKPPFYAASISPVWHDSYGGLRINGKAQVIDMQGHAIPGLYAGGEVERRRQPARPWPLPGARLHRRLQHGERAERLII